MPTIAFVTYHSLPDLSKGDQLVLPHLHTRGLQTAAVVWDDPAVVWQKYATVVVRSCWDYHRQPEAFAAWLTRLERMRVPIWNPVPLMRWNMHKGYLRDLQGRGVAIPPTVWLERSDDVRLADILERHGWDEAVVKPAVSATAYQTWRTSRAAAAADQPRFAALIEQTSLLVQQFVPAVVADGEWSLIFFGRQYSHAVLKRAKAGDFRVQDDFGGTAILEEPAASVLAEAQRIVDAVPEPLLYTRVDGVVVHGRFVLMELELIEPGLFLTMHPPAAERFADAILALVR